jgi:hypothetical protein
MAFPPGEQRPALSPEQTTPEFLVPELMAGHCFLPLNTLPCPCTNP